MPRLFYLPLVEPGVSLSLKATTKPPRRLKTLRGGLLFALLRWVASSQTDSKRHDDFLCMNPGKIQQFPGTFDNFRAGIPRGELLARCIWTRTKYPPHSFRFDKGLDCTARLTMLSSWMDCKYRLVILMFSWPSSRDKEYTSRPFLRLHCA